MKQFCRDQLHSLNKAHGRMWYPLKIQIQQNRWFRGKCNGAKKFDMALANKLTNHPILRSVYRTGAFLLLTGGKGGRGWEGEIIFENETVAVIKNNHWVFSRHVSVLEKANHWFYPRSCIAVHRSYGPRCRF